MRLLETSYLVDYEKGDDVARDYFDAHEHEPLRASTISAFELAFGVVWSGGGDPSILYDSLSWLDFLEFSVEDAFEGARVLDVMQSDGTRIPIADAMIAGVARNRGATLVSSDEHFLDVPDLSVENYRQ